jgi:hypothetical protein
MAKYLDKAGKEHRIDGGGNHFINGKCVNPLSDGIFSPVIGSTYVNKEMKEVDDTIHAIGHVPNFVFYDRDSPVQGKTVEVRTGHPAW